jgi:hypothetical protein
MPNMSLTRMEAGDLAAYIVNDLLDAVTVRA